MSFATGMIYWGKQLQGIYSVKGSFALTAVLAVLALVILFSAVPEPPKIIHSYSEEEAR